MNPEEALNLIPSAIQQRQPSNCGKWVLHWTVCGIRCIPIEQRRTAEFPLAIITDDEVQESLTNEKWNIIKHKIAQIMEGKPK